MSLQHWFRLSQYLMLGLSCAALVFAEVPFLPELQLCLAPVLALLLLAWGVEGRWRLPNWGANLLGLLIAVGGVTWLVTQLSDNDFVLAHLPLHLALLPYMGPLSMAALLVKVFRLRDAGHFWHLQGWGLLQIGLGCLLDGGPAFGALMTAYLACDLICLALHYRLSAQKVASGQPSRVRERAGEIHRFALNDKSPPLVTSHWLLAFSLRWTLLISAMALLLFLLTPRRDSWSWEPLSTLRSGSGRGSHGVNEEMNLNNTGRVQLDDAVALRVVAVDASGQPKLDLPGDQRWRGSVLDWYEQGRWTTIRLLPMPMWRRGQDKLPDFGPDQFFLTFTVHPWQAGGLVLAEPIHFGRHPRRLPVVSLADENRLWLFVEFEGTVLSSVSGEQGGEYRYCQVVPGGGDSGRVSADGLPAERDIPLLQTLPSPLQGPLQDWTVDLLRRLAPLPRYGLPEGVRAALAQPHPDFRNAAYYWEAVARALDFYLAHSGEYAYSLENSRQDRALDPVLDFLTNVKEGHCERYAAALALMLRSVGVPARVIKGYRGCESQGRGQYVVRHSHAHAWVEALVPHPPNANRPNMPPRWDWLTLDATPPEPAVPVDTWSLAYLWDETGRFCLLWWRNLIVEYNGEEQADLWDTMTSAPSLPLLLKPVLAILVCGAGFLLWRFLRHLRLPRNAIHLRLPRRKPTGDCGAGIYSRLVKILARYVSLRPRFAQTPREYSAEVQTILQTRPALAALADLPRRVVDLFYRVRYGSQPLSEGERQRMEMELTRFAEVLRQSD